MATPREAERANVAGRVRLTSRRTGSDAVLITLALAHGGLLLAWPSIPLIAVALWWNANTISHNFIHRPFFRSASRNAVFSCYLSLLLGFPQSLWRARHLAHHTGRPASDFKPAPVDLVAAAVLWTGLAVLAPHFALSVYLPGYLIGLALCLLQGHYEHAGGTVSHYGRVYNALFLNDGYHVEHHAQPGAHWRELGDRKAAEAATSRWPAVLRWLECANLCALERLVLRSTALQRFVLNRHERAMLRLLQGLPRSAHVGIVGGGLFPRTALILRRLMPEAKLTLIDMSAENLAVARRIMGGEVEYVNERFDPGSHSGFDLLVIPLSFIGNREEIYRRPPGSALLVHDWIWRRRGTSAVVSWLLLKRLNLVRR